jgi:hypothetical protein
MKSGPTTIRLLFLQYLSRLHTAFAGTNLLFPITRPALADWLDHKTGPMTDVHLWTSWFGDTPDQLKSFSQQQKF